mmetsp:Transcript_21308/g.52473  ORF Transcript_21308/g.52473 Transcript_21308/m.52473 type:complete len:251 (-) Transcript_21308:270-1022(-)
MIRPLMRRALSSTDKDDTARIADANGFSSSKAGGTSPDSITTFISWTSGSSAFDASFEPETISSNLEAIFELYVPLCKSARRHLRALSFLLFSRDQRIARYAVLIPSSVFRSPTTQKSIRRPAEETSGLKYFNSFIRSAASSPLRDRDQSGLVPAFKIAGLKVVIQCRPLVYASNEGVSSLISPLAASLITRTCSLTIAFPNSFSRSPRRAPLIALIGSESESGLFSSAWMSKPTFAAHFLETLRASRTP